MATLADFYKKPDVEFQYPGASYKLRFHMTDQEVYLQRYCEFGKVWDRTRSAGYHWAFLCRDDFEEIVPMPVADHWVVVVGWDDGEERAYEYATLAEAIECVDWMESAEDAVRISKPIPVLVK